MHWRQREMLFEQREALKGNLEEKRQPQDTGFGAKSPKLREPDSRVAAKSSKPRTGGGLQGPAKKKKRRSFEGAHEKDEGMHSKKEGMHSKREGKHSKKEGMHSKKEGMHSKKEGKHLKREGMHSKKEGKHLKKKAESHCEAYAEAYVRGVEAALRESRR